LARGGNGFSWRATAETLSGGNWLRLFPSEGSSMPGSSSYADLIVDAAGLEPGEYHGEVRIDAEGVSNAPRTVWVVLQLVRDDEPVAPVIRPGGLVFTVSPGAGGLAPQRITVQNLSAASVGLDWALQGDARAFRLSGPEQRTIPSGQTLALDVEAVPGSLGAGVYRAAVGIRASNEPTVRQVDLMLIVAPDAAASPKAATRYAGACRPTRLQPVSTGQLLGFTAPGGLPLPLDVRVHDDCGDPLTDGAVSVSFSTGSPSPISLAHVGGGRWSGTWPVAQALGTSVTLTVTAEDAERRLLGSIELGGNVQANEGAPIIDDRGIVSSASVRPGLPLAAGGMVRVTGQRLVDGAATATAPLPGQLANARLILGGREAPLANTGADVNGSVIVGVLPFDLQPNIPYQASVRRGNRRSNFVEVITTSVQPAVFTVDRSGNGQGLLYGGVEAVALADSLNPAARGDRVQILAEGLGVVTPAVPAGEPGPADPQAAVAAPVSVTIGGAEAVVESAVLAPGQAGIYVISAIVPLTIDPGEAVPVVVTAGGVVSEPVTIAIR
jgi:uncharacterized protein (TIGR03437 family)